MKLLFLTTFFTVFFASCVARIVEKVSRSEEDILKKARMWSVMVFCLKYTCLVQFSGLDALNGSILFSLINKIIKLPSIFVMKETELFMNRIESSVWLGSCLVWGRYQGISLSPGSKISCWERMLLLLPHSYTTFALECCIIPMAWLVFCNIFIQFIFHYGKLLGETIYVESTGNRNYGLQRIQEYKLLPTERPSVVGVMCIVPTTFYMVYLMSV